MSAGMGSQIKSNLIPAYLKASTPDLLIELMLEHNLKLGGFVTYQDIQESKDGNWYAWFYLETDFFDKIKNYKSSK